MITIDGGHLEGGGQIVRAAVALSSLTREPVRIMNIRANRSPQGLAAQHVAAVIAAEAVSGAETEGVQIRSTEILFYPGIPVKKDIRVDIGTAGSIPLVLSAWLPQALETGGTITITGGTEVRAAPTIDYWNGVFLEYLRSHGARVSMEIESRGYYPIGGGQVKVHAEPSAMSALGATAPCGCGIISASSGLPDHVAARQASAAASIAGDLPVRIIRQRGPGVGSSCTVYSGGHGGAALGERGLPAEDVGRMAGEAFLEYPEGDVDPYLADQLLIYLAAKGGSFTTQEITSHSMTMIRLLEQFGYTITLTDHHGCVEVSA
ncbi:MAG: RNA 3'-terminal phosphate cyclase [Methanocalculus sp.]|uniref:RNA 3'-terminal phosphate cyclase n=1 Tax=Methanocalculus sp. TaxID=2004547 RepID=UPI00271810E1|nr:RNA 3'-terminal phosphate cyclase [Methanocalculus sp.]MDO9540046.1 RNA 3'-terminal phosphate cyclase [Methanocalculus sp.]